MFNRWIEPELLPLLAREGVGCIAFSPLARGLLTNRYFEGIPADSRAGHDPRFLRPDQVTDVVLAKTRALDAIAKARGQTLAQLALAWVLRSPSVTSALIGASKVKQVEDCAAAARNVAFSAEELAQIDRILT
jgi:L-glyceraldehyde 3-phosphate reductase